MSINWTRVQGDTSPALTATLRHEPANGARLGSPVDLSGATSIIGVVRRETDGLLVNDEAVDNVNLLAGEVAIILTPTISAEPSLCLVEFVVTWPDRQITYNGYSLLIEADLSSGAAPAAPVPPGSGLPSGGGGPSDSETFTADETLSALQVVVRTATGVAAYDPTAPDPGKPYGLATTAATVGNPITVATDGPVDSAGAGFTPGATYYAAAGGALTATAPTAGRLVPIGYAADVDTFVVEFGQIIHLAS